METVRLEQNSKRLFDIQPGKVGFLWGAVSDRGLKCVVVDGVVIREGAYNPPYVLRKMYGFFSGSSPTNVEYLVETFDEERQGPLEEKEKPVRVKKVVSRLPHLINHVLRDGGTWYEIHFPVDMASWQMKARGNHTVFYSFDPSHQNYVTLQPGQVVSENTMPNRSIWSVFVMSEDDDVTMEVEVWRECQK